MLYFIKFNNNKYIISFNKLIQSVNMSMLSCPIDINSGSAYESIETQQKREISVSKIYANKIYFNFNYYYIIKNIIIIKIN